VPLLVHLQNFHGMCIAGSTSHNNFESAMSAINNPMGAKIAAWLRQGVSPRRLALTLALGIAIGCIPVIGVPTVLCAALALTLRLNLPAIQAANYAAMPLQLLLIVPFVRLGEFLFSGGTSAARGSLLLPLQPFTLLAHFGALAAHALLAWLVVAGPAVAIMTAVFTLLLRQIPEMAGEESIG
jgi:uncharacterized protein (DUF2062 family)